ncbi:hypothetical protein Zmor_027665 [Zophobas morio]|uniref:Uncharacterized protein n=1 Tax=Zophobas morio TaxID=2755281 RepID=A0AA38HNN0_9CUCU|nr:hypothetical protein Zmor_027665 [Zophobas morio]
MPRWAPRNRATSIYDYSSNKSGSINQSRLCSPGIHLALGMRKVGMGLVCKLDVPSTAYLSQEKDCWVSRPLRAASTGPAWRRLKSS